MAINDQTPPDEPEDAGHPETPPHLLELYEVLEYERAQDEDQDDDPAG